jgi:hypothetical protein
MKIDCHVHVTPPDIIANWEKYAKKEPYFSLLFNSKLAFSKRNMFATAEDVIAEMEQNDFDKSVVFGFAFSDMGLCRYVNDYVIEKVKQFPEKLIGFAVVPTQNASIEIERCYNAGLKGVGELFPAKHWIIDENEKEISTVTGACKELNLPLLLHANEPVGHYYPGKTNINLKQLEKFVINNPEIKIILAHFGGGLLFYETMKEIKESFRNVYYDTAAAPFLYDSRIYRVIKALDLCEKILFGSDFPLLSPSRYFGDIEDGGFSGEEKQLIMGGNARMLLGC